MLNLCYADIMFVYHNDFVAREINNTHNRTSLNQNKHNNYIIMILINN